MSLKQSKTRLTCLKVLLSVETEVGDWLTVFIVTLKWEVFINDNVCASLSVVTDVREAFVAACVVIEVKLDICGIFLCSY